MDEMAVTSVGAPDTFTTQETDLAGARRPRSTLLAGKAGLLPRQEIRNLAYRKVLRATQDLDEAQFQPASLDLRLGPRAYRVRASFLPGPTKTVEE
jgi:dCTP deaminase